MLLLAAHQCHLRFNPRTREGCDRAQYDSADRQLRFNPRTREGCDVRKIAREYLEVWFQSTHP